MAQPLRSDRLVQGVTSGVPVATPGAAFEVPMLSQGFGALTSTKCGVGLERGCDLRAMLQMLHLKISTSNVQRNRNRAQTLTRVHNFAGPKIAYAIERKQIVAFLERG